MLMLMMPLTMTMAMTTTTTMTMELMSEGSCSRFLLPAVRYRQPF